MKRAFALFLFIISFGFSEVTSAGEIALSFDDAPTAGSAFYSGPKRTEELIKKLKVLGIPKVAIFCTTKDSSEEDFARIKAYGDAGHIIANHSHSHFKLDTVGATTYVDDMKVADKLLSPMPNFRKWFRFPFLNEGNDISVRDDVRSALKTMGYVNGYVTVDNYDWAMNHLLQKAMREKKKVNLKKFETLFVDTLWEGIQLYDGVAQKYLGRSPKHVLLLHETDAATMNLEALVKKIRDNGWTIISPEEAYQDPIALEVTKTHRNGQGRVMAMAIDRGYQGPYNHPTEDEVYLEKLFNKEVIE